jgi:hypothetical protein
MSSSWSTLARIGSLERSLSLESLLLHAPPELGPGRCRFEAGQQYLLLCCIKVVCKHQTGSGRPFFLLLVVCPSVKEK